MFRVSELLARSVAKTPTHVKVSFTAMLSLQPLFLLPITFPFSGNEIVVLNEPTGAPRPNPPQVTSIAITADSPKQGEQWLHDGSHSALSRSC